MMKRNRLIILHAWRPYHALGREGAITRVHDGPIIWINVHHPRTKKNDAGQHNIGDERLVADGKWESMNLGIYFGQRLMLDRRQQGMPLRIPRYALDIAAGAQGRGMEPAVRIKRAAHESAQAMGGYVLTHVMPIPGWTGIWLGNGIAGLTDAEIAHHYPKFAREWQEWRQDERPMPPDLPGADSEVTADFVKRVLRGMRLIIEHRRSNFIVANMSRSVLQVVHAALQGYDLAQRIPYIDPAYGTAEEWRLSAGPPENISGCFMRASELSKLLYPQRVSAQVIE